MGFPRLGSKNLLVVINVKGEPAPQGSKKYIGHGRMIESSKKLPAWREKIIAACKTQYKGDPIDNPVQVQANFLIPTPKKPRFNRPATVPDLDKLQRALGDGLEQGGVLKNDSRIVAWDATKHYARPGEEGVMVLIKEIN